MAAATPEEARLQIINLVREFVRRDVAPVAQELDREDRVPHDLIDSMKEMGLFGITVPEEYGGLGLDYTTFATIFEELSKGFMSLSGAIGTHHILTYVLTHYGTEEQKNRFLPDLASGRKRGALALTEPGGGSDVASLTTAASKDGEEYVINGTKMFITNGRHGDAFCLLARTNSEAQPNYRGISCFVVEKGGPGFKVGRDLDKMGVPGAGHLRTGIRGLPGAGGKPGRRTGGTWFQPGDERTGDRPHQRRRPCGGAWPRPPLKLPSATPSSGKPSAFPYPSTRPSN